MKKSKSKNTGILNKDLYFRASFLYQAATFLNRIHQPAAESEKDSGDPAARTTQLGSGLSRRLVSDLYGVSLKAQIRLSPSIKHTACKRCHNLLVEGSTLKIYMENKSRGGKKPWADVLVHECTQCGKSRRFPVGAKRQRRRNDRQDHAAAKVASAT